MQFRTAAAQQHASALTHEHATPAQIYDRLITMSQAVPITGQRGGNYLTGGASSITCADPYLPYLTEE